MRKYVRTGRECATTAPCNTGYSDSHNERIGKNPNETIDRTLSKNNYIWKNENILSLPEFLEKIKADYASIDRPYKKDGQTLYKKKEMPCKGKTAAHPIKETILLLPSNGKETDKMAIDFTNKASELTGWKPLRLYIHRDEIYTDPDTGETRPNSHAHIVWSCYDWQKHETIKASREDMRKMQDIASETTGMERGIPSGKKHLSVSQWKNEQERQRTKELEEAYLEQTQITIENGHSVATQFDELRMMEQPYIEEQESREKLRIALTDIERTKGKKKRHEFLKKIAENTRETMKAIQAMTERLMERTAAAIAAFEKLQARQHKEEQEYQVQTRIPEAPVTTQQRPEQRPQKRGIRM